MNNSGRKRKFSFSLSRIYVLCSTWQRFLYSRDPPSPLKYPSCRHRVRMYGGICHVEWHKWCLWADGVLEPREAARVGPAPRRSSSALQADVAASVFRPRSCKKKCQRVVFSPGTHFGVTWGAWENSAPGLSPRISDIRVRGPALAAFPPPFFLNSQSQVIPWSSPP